ncbi:histidine ammonia-lyase [Actinoplanes cyaneus]|uniref:Histidine ammonia-lyase n=1 Tax=Actinoplanes cyaneus TaxID=52696 RepID=A0A919ITQ3_9ACTN|nr:aromatic amino acid lyase [Actinoplanes cyaneus]MCW2139840.1 histidine ammonia-lyase [Actinoplanes cyaneus]GID67870.1 histidine ammonia-lyase [Actinoplanes cyaneus]
MTGELRVRTAADLSRTEIVLVAREAKRVVLEPALLAEVAASRAATLAALDGDQPVYGVNTGMGALAGIRLDAEARARHQDTLMAGRAVGSAPWLRPDQARAVLAVRLRTLLHPAAGVSPELCGHLADLLNGGVVPAIPARGAGAAGEIIPLAHLGAVLIGTGQVLDAAGRAVDVTGVRPRSFGAKEGVAFLEGVPGLTGLAVLATQAVRALADQVVTVAGAAHAVIGASADPLRAELAAGDDELRTVNAALLAARGDGPVRALQAPVSFRVTGPALAVVVRATGALDAAAERALIGVTDSPAQLDGRFYGTAGFAGTDLAAACGALTTALVHLAEVGAARLHRLLDPAVTGLPKQLSDAPGLHAGMVAVHKRAVGVAHRLRRFAMPALTGAMETSGGQEDVQSFGFEAAECLGEAIDGLREVLACEMLAVHQARLLSGGPGGLLPPGTLPAGTADRPFGRDLDTLIELLRSGWSSGAR